MPEMITSAFNLDLLYNLIILAIVAVLIGFSFSKYVRESDAWKATVTPLASIIGSGFLVVTPLLVMILGKYAVLAVTGIVVMAYLLGYVMRFNIEHIETNIKSPNMKYITRFLEHVSFIVISVAYFISIAFYIELLAIFVLKGLGIKSVMLGNWLATAILAFIGIAGGLRGFKNLEMMEEYSVNMKLAIIVAMIVALLAYNIKLAFLGTWEWAMPTPELGVDTIRKLLGIIIIIQGFETSRFISRNYSAAMRIRTMRYAQIIAGVIYVSFVGLAMVMFKVIDFDTVDETTIIDISGNLTTLMPALLIISAGLSQFSAAIADTVGAGGLLIEVAELNINRNLFYVFVSIIAIVLVWATDVFGIISLASRAFALYYGIQAAEAAITTFYQSHSLRGKFRVVLMSLIAITMFLATIYGMPVH